MTRATRLSTSRSCSASAAVMTPLASRVGKPINAVIAAYDPVADSLFELLFGRLGRDHFLERDFQDAGRIVDVFRNENVPRQPVPDLARLQDMACATLWPNASDAGLKRRPSGKTTTRISGRAQRTGKLSIVPPIASWKR